MLNIQIEGLKSIAKDASAPAAAGADTSALKDQIAKLEGLLGKCRETLKCGASPPYARAHVMQGQQRKDQDVDNGKRAAAWAVWKYKGVSIHLSQCQRGQALLL